MKVEVDNMYFDVELFLRLLMPSRGFGEILLSFFEDSFEIFLIMFHMKAFSVLFGNSKNQSKSM